MRAAATAYAVLLVFLALSACSTTEALDPGALAAAQPAAASVPASEPAALQPTATGPVANATGVRMSFAPLVGATLTAATPLSRRLSQLAAERGIEIVQGPQASGDYLVKGYLSAIGEKDETIVIYVWDVVDVNGTRLHRIQGQERVAAPAAADPWQSVPNTTMEQIADRTIAALQSWSVSQRG